MLERKDHEAIGENADDDGGHAVEQIRGVTHNEGHGAPAEFGQVDRPQEADGNTDQRGQEKQLGAADDGVGHAAACFAHGSRQFREEIPVDGRAAMVDEIAQNEEEHRDRDDGAETGHGEHEIAHEFAPA